MDGTLSRNAQVVKFFAQTERGILRKWLAKSVFVADLSAWEHLGHPISEFQYRLYKFGPYPPAITDAIAELESHELAWRKDTEPDEEGRTFKRLFDTGRRVNFDFTPAENELLGYVVQTYLHGMGMRELLDDLVYQAEPMRRADRFGEWLKMDVVRNAGVKRTGFNLEDLVNSERQAERGDYVAAREFFDAIQNRSAARHTSPD